MHISVVQVNFNIPPEIDAGLLAGVYQRIGDVIRYATGPKKGQIVMHLKPIDTAVAEEAKGLAQKAFAFVRANKNGLIICAIAVGVTVISGFFWYKFKTHEPKIVIEFKLQLSNYIEAIRIGSLAIEDIDSLLLTLNEIKKRKDYDKIIVKLSVEELYLLLNCLNQYTIKLAEANSVEINEDEINPKKEDDVIQLFERHLNTQKRIFEKAS